MLGNIPIFQKHKVFRPAGLTDDSLKNCGFVQFFAFHQQTKSGIRHAPETFPCSLTFAQLSSLASVVWPLHRPWHHPFPAPDPQFREVLLDCLVEWPLPP